MLGSELTSSTRPQLSLTSSVPQSGLRSQGLSQGLRSQGLSRQSGRAVDLSGIALALF